MINTPSGKSDLKETSNQDGQMLNNATKKPKYKSLSHCAFLLPYFLDKNDQKKEMFLSFSI